MYKVAIHRYHFEQELQCVRIDKFINYAMMLFNYDVREISVRYKIKTKERKGMDNVQDSQLSEF